LAIAHVGDGSVEATSAATATATYSSTTGNTLIAYISAYVDSDTLLSIDSITDTAGNTWQYSTLPASQSPPANGGYDTGDGYYGFAAVAYCIGATAVTSVTALLNNTCVVFYLGVTEFSGISSSATIDGSASAQVLASDTSYTTPAAATAATADAVVAVLAYGTGFTSVAAGSGSATYTLVEMGGVAAGKGAAWGISSTAANQSVTFTGSGAQEVVAAAILAIGAPAPPNPAAYVKPALPGRTWQRRFKHGQAPVPPAPPPPNLINVVQSRAIPHSRTGRFYQPTTAGNTVVVIVVAYSDDTAAPAITGITLGGSPDRFAPAVAETIGRGTIAAIWYDPGCAGGQTVVHVGGNLTTDFYSGIIILEVSGVLTLDQTSAAKSYHTAAWSSGTVTTTVADEIWIGADQTVYSTPQPAGWTNYSFTGSGTGGGYQIVNATSTVSYGDTQEGRSGWVAALATFYQGSTSPVTITGSPATVTITAQPGSVLTGPVVVQSVTGGTTNDYGLDSVPITTTPGNTLVVLAGWTIAFYSYQAGGTVPAVNVTDSAGNLWRQVAISSRACAGARGAIWVATNAQAVDWVSVATTAWSFATAYTVLEVAGMPDATLLDFSVTDFSETATTSLSVTGTAGAVDTLFAALVSGYSTQGTSLSAGPAGWTALPVSTQYATSNTYSPANGVTVFPYWIPTGTGAGSVPASYTLTTATPVAVLACGLSQAATAPAQPNPNFPLVIVEAAFGAVPGDITASTEYTYDIQGVTWTDITSRVISTDGDTSIHLHRGRQYELAQQETGEIEIRVNNLDGALTPGNAASPYYPNVVLGTPVRVSCWWGGRQYALAQGYVERWPQAWPDLPQWGFSTLLATDAFSILSAVDMHSAMQGDIINDQPYAYFPASEQYSLAQEGLYVTYVPIDAGGLTAVNYAPDNNNPAVYVDGPSGNEINTGLALNLLGDSNTAMGTSGYQAGASGVGGPGLTYTDPNQPNTTSYPMTYEFWFVYTSPTIPCNLLGVFGSPSNYKVSAGSNNGSGRFLTVGLNYASSTNTITVAGQTSVQYSLPTASSGTPQHIAVTVPQGGGAAIVYINGVAQSSTVTIGSAPAVTATALGPVQYSFDPEQASYYAYNYVAGHLAIYGYQLTPARIWDHYVTGVSGWNGVPAPQRFAQIMSWANVGLKRGGMRWDDITPGQHQSEITQISEAYQLSGSSPASALFALQQSENGWCFIQGNGSVIYIPRWATYNAGPVAAFGDNGVSEIPYLQDSAWDYDNSYLYNEVTATQQRGPVQYETVYTRDIASGLEYFLRSALSVSSYVSNPEDVYDIVNWYINKYGQPSLRLRSLTIDAASLADSGPVSAFPAVLSLELQDVVTVTRRPVGGAVISQLGIIERVEHSIGPSLWKTAYQISPYTIEGSILTADSTGTDILGQNSLGW